MSLVEEAIKSWETHRAGVIAEVENAPEEHFGYRTGDGARSFREIAVHIAETGVCFVDQLLAPDGNFFNLFRPDVQAELKARLPEAHTKAELVALLRQTGEDGAARLLAVGEALATQTMPSRTGTQSRLSGLWFTIAHEMYHRGQLAAYERGFGTEPALTRQLHAAIAAQGGQPTR